MSALREITLTENPDGWWTATDEATGAVSQGPTRTEALANLDDAIELLVNEEAGRTPTEDELRELGIDPEANESGELPDVLQ